jgi:hypothetical protein
MPGARPRGCRAPSRSSRKEAVLGRGSAQPDAHGRRCPRGSPTRLAPEPQRAGRETAIPSQRRTITWLASRRCANAWTARVAGQGIGAEPAHDDARRRRPVAGQGISRPGAAPRHRTPRGPASAPRRPGRRAVRRGRAPEAEAQARWAAGQPEPSARPITSGIQPGPEPHPSRRRRRTPPRKTGQSATGPLRSRGLAAANRRGASITVLRERRALQGWVRSFHTRSDATRGTKPGFAAPYACARCSA